MTVAGKAQSLIDYANDRRDTDYDNLTEIIENELDATQSPVAHIPTAPVVERAQSLIDYANETCETSYDNLTDVILNNLKGQRIYTIEDKQPYLLRNSADGAQIGLQERDKLIGGTIAWNQLIKSTKVGETVNGVTITNNGDGSFTFNGTATDRGNYIFSDVPVTVGHKFLGQGAKGGLRITISGINVDTTGNGGIWNDTLSDYSSLWLRGDWASGAVFDNVKVYPQFFDLTQMFGTEVADYIYSLEQSTAGAGVALFRKLFPKEYYEYNAGQLISVSGVSAHVMRDASSNVIGNYPLDSSLTLRGIPKLVNNKIQFDGDVYEADGTVTRKYGIRAYQSGDDSLANAITDGTNTVYKLSATTTETATPFQNPQKVNPNGTEEYVCVTENDVVVPVGHDTLYSTD